MGTRKVTTVGHVVNIVEIFCKITEVCGLRRADAATAGLEVIGYSVAGPGADCTSAATFVACVLL